MSTSPVLRDQSALSRIDRVVLRVEAILNVLGGLTIVALVLLAVVHIVGRKLFNAPVFGYVDWIQQFMIVFAFFGISYCQREGGHIRMDILVGRLRGRALWLAELASVIFMALVTAGLVYGSWAHFRRAIDWRGDWAQYFDTLDFSALLISRDSTIDIGLPTWPAKLIVPVMLSILFLRLLLQIWGFARALITGAKRPVAVPLIEDAQTQAAREAETVSGSG
ncbi:MAG: TRAP transporter small permease [Pseudomonadota bacterium]